MKGFAFTNSNELIGTFEVHHEFSLLQDIEIYSKRKKIPVNSYIEAWGKKWDVISSNPIRVQERKIVETSTTGFYSVTELVSRAFKGRKGCKKIEAEILERFLIDKPPIIVFSYIHDGGEKRRRLLVAGIAEWFYERWIPLLSKSNEIQGIDLSKLSKQQIDELGQQIALSLGVEKRVTEDSPKKSGTFSMKVVAWREKWDDIFQNFDESVANIFDYEGQIQHRMVNVVIPYLLQGYQKLGAQIPLIRSAITSGQPKQKTEATQVSTMQIDYDFNDTKHAEAAYHAIGPQVSNLGLEMEYWTELNKLSCSKKGGGVIDKTTLEHIASVMQASEGTPSFKIQTS